ncbi:SphA family protein [Propionivibrio sp.]|uniref:SphA family protein n=1 Tax=Propionivibrio sp. TaxID=2212460 RepID=UPI003BF07C98
MQQSIQDRSHDAAARPTPLRKTRHALRCAALLAGLVAAFGHAGGVQAVEGGSGVYALGYIAPQAGLMPDPGSYFSVNYYAYNGTSTANVSATRQVSIAGTHLKLQEQLTGSIKTQVDSASSLFSLTHVFTETMLGGNPGLAVLLPYAKADLDLTASGVFSLTGPSGRSHSLSLSGKDSQRDSGIGDTTLTGLLGWHDGRLHSMAMLNVYAPTGSFDKQRAVNVGRNHWAIEPMAALTWLNEATGLEVSGAAGITFNQINPATDYKSGDEFHLDLTVIQHVSEKFYLGLVAYAYQQLTGDSGSGATSAYKGRVYSLGPIIGGMIPLGQKQQLFINGRYYQESGVENRLKGNTFFLTGTVKF